MANGVQPELSHEMPTTMLQNMHPSADFNVLFRPIAHPESPDMPQSWSFSFRDGSELAKAAERHETPRKQITAVSAASGTATRASAPKSRESAKTNAQAHSRSNSLIPRPSGSTSNAVASTSQTSIQPPSTIKKASKQTSKHDSLKTLIKKPKKTQADCKGFNCDYPGCGRWFERGHDLRRHIKIHTDSRSFFCARCKTAFGRRDTLKRHQDKLGCLQKLAEEGLDGSFEPVDDSIVKRRPGRSVKTRPVGGKEDVKPATTTFSELDSASGQTAIIQALRPSEEAHWNSAQGRKSRSEASAKAIFTTNIITGFPVDSQMKRASSSQKLSNVTNNTNINTNATANAKSSSSTSRLRVRRGPALPAVNNENTPIQYPSALPSSQSMPSLSRGQLRFDDKPSVKKIIEPVSSRIRTMSSILDAIDKNPSSVSMSPRSVGALAPSSPSLDHLTSNSARITRLQAQLIGLPSELLE